VRPRSNTGGTQEPIGTRYPEQEIDGSLALPHKVLAVGAGRVICQGWTRNAPKRVEIKEPTSTKGKTLVGVCLTDV